MGLAATFLGLIETLSSHISPDAVAKFAGHLEHVEQRLADLEIKVTGKVAEFVEKAAAPTPVEPTPVAAAAVDAGQLLAQLAQLLAAAQAPAVQTVPAPVVTPDAAG